MKRIAILTVFLIGCPPPPASTDDSPAAPEPVLDADCVRDEDCALLPYVTCCGECPPAPPFDVGTRSNLDAIFIELETQCALDLRECTPPECDPMPAGCYAKAACVDGRCVVETDGCGVPMS